MSKRRKKFKKRRFTQSKLTSGPKLLRRVRILEKKVVAEVKTHTVTDTDNMSIAGTVINLTSIGQGDTNVLRSGNNVRIKMIKMNCYVFKNAGNSQARLRFILIRDKQQQADIVPAVLSVLTTASVVSHLNPNTRGRFEVLWDRMFALDSTVTSRTFRRTIFTKFITQWNGPNGADIQRNGLFFILLGEDNALPTQILHNTRLEYYDN